MTDPWNHNTAYHPWIVRIAAQRGHRDLLDVGCGDGLLLEHLAPVMRTVTGVEPDTAVFTRARARLATVANARLMRAGFADAPVDRAQFDLVTFVASLHHLPLHAALVRATDVLRPGGDLVVVGIAANRSPADWAFLALSFPMAWAGSAMHRETRDTGVPVAAPTTSLTEIRAAAREVLPGARIRRGVYYRYLLRWTKPGLRTGR